VAGTDLSFGKNGEGNSAFLLEESGKFGFKVEIIDKISYKGEIISSTLVRKAISEGDVKKARFMLGSPYFVQGVVKKGNQIGRTIGFPTANMQLYEPLKLVPGNGVYFVKVNVLGRSLYGMCNIGCRPTVGAGNARTIETNIFGFDEDIYGLDMEVTFMARIRQERKFGSMEELKAQLEQDRDTCLLILSDSLSS
jgi:riboflavin kinase/FMN adenylyltransferase